MTRLTGVARRRRACAVLAQPVAVVGEVALRQELGILERPVAVIAGARRAVVTAKARRHRWPEVIVAVRDADVTPHAVALARGRVLAVIEDEVIAGLGELRECIRRGMASEARMRVVRLRVARRAGRDIGDVRRGSVVAGRTRDAGERVAAVRERLGPGVSQAEHARAGDECEAREQCDLHRAPQRRESCASTSSRRRSWGDAETSSATAACHVPSSQPIAPSAHGQSCAT